MNVAGANAQRLVRDATMLFEAGRFATEASVAILAIEEAGKVPILRSLSVARTNEELSDTWRDYRSHTKKNAAWILPDLVANGARKLDDLRPLFDSNSDHPYIPDQVKQLGFYSDCLGKAHWSSPEDVIDKTLAHSLLKIATTLAPRKNHTSEEVKLWMKHIGPVWKKDLSRRRSCVGTLRCSKKASRPQALKRIAAISAARAIAILLKRKLRCEHVERFRRREVELEAEQLCTRIVTWILPLIGRLRDARPALPEELTDRQQDSQKPLIAIADAAGGDWPEASRGALVALCAEAQDSRGGKMLPVSPLGDGEGTMHYHIRWANSKVDWQAFRTSEAAEIDADKLARPGETYIIVEFENDCPHCGAIREHVQALRKRQVPPL